MKTLSAKYREIVTSRHPDMMVCNGRQQRRYSEAEALAYVAKGYHLMWRMESVGCHYTRMTTPDAVVSSYAGPEGVGYVAYAHRERLGFAPYFMGAAKLVDASYGKLGVA